MTYSQATLKAPVPTGLSYLNSYKPAHIGNHLITIVIVNVRASVRSVYQTGQSSVNNY